MRFLILLTVFYSFSVSAITFKADVKGMVCQMCVHGMRKSFKPYVKNPEKDVIVSLDDSTVTVNLKKKMDDEKITSLIKDAGYNAEKIHWQK